MTDPAIEDILKQFATLNAKLQTLTSRPPPPTAQSTLAERMRQHVLRAGRATMPELQRALGIEKSAAHYYSSKLAADAAVTLLFAPHEPSHSTVKEAWDPRRIVELTPERFPAAPSLDEAEAMLGWLESHRAARRTGTTG